MLIILRTKYITAIEVKIILTYEMAN